MKLDDEFNRLFNLYNKDIYRVIYSHTFNTNESKDLLQDTFLKLYKNIDKLPKDDLQIKKWLITVANNCCNDFFRTFWKSKVTCVDIEKANTSYNQKFNIEIEDILNKLNKKLRIPIYLYYYDGYKIEEISDMLDEKVSTIKMRLSKAKEIIKKEMEKI